MFLHERKWRLQLTLYIVKLPTHEAEQDWPVSLPHEWLSALAEAGPEAMADLLVGGGTTIMAKLLFASLTINT
eukprot:12901714-Prorocentrum_lima.AAC.1